MGECFLYRRGAARSGGSGGGAVGTEMTAIGSVLTLSNSLQRPLKGLRILGRTTQNGTPTPDAPVALVSPGDDGVLDVWAAGKNLIDYKKAQPGNSNSITVDESINGVQWTGTYFFIIPVDIPAGTTVAFSCKSEGDDAIDSYNLVYEDGTTAYNILNRATLAQKRVTQLRVRKRNTSTKNSVTVWDMQLESVPAGTVDIVAEYEPYKDIQALPLSTPNGLPGIPVASGGNYTDTSGLQWVCDYVDCETVEYVQMCDYFVFTGNEALGTAGTVGSLGYYAFVSNRTVQGKPNVDSMCNYLKSRASTVQGSDGSASDRVNIASGGNGTNFPRLCIAHSVLGTSASSSDSVCLTALRNWLKARYNEGNPLIIVSQLATPIRTPLSAEEMAAYAALHTYAPSTTIYNDGGAEMEVKYMSIGG